MIIEVKYRDAVLLRVGIWHLIFSHFVRCGFGGNVSELTLTADGTNIPQPANYEEEG